MMYASHFAPGSNCYPMVYPIQRIFSLDGSLLKEVYRIGDCATIVDYLSGNTYIIKKGKLISTSPSQNKYIVTPTAPPATHEQYSDYLKTLKSKQLVPYMKY